MWLARIKYQHQDCVITPKAVKHKLKIYATPGSSVKQGKYLYNTGFLMLSGLTESKKKFIKDLKKDKRVIQVEVTKDLIVFIEKVSLNKKEHSAFRSKEIMCVKPVYCNPDDGFEYWEICSWDKKHLNSFLSKIKKLGQAKLLSIGRMKLNDVYHYHLSPKITDRQKQVLELALQFGYYDIPRKVELNKLAKKLKISRQAVSEHLRKAESKILPNLAKEFLK